MSVLVLRSFVLWEDLSGVHCLVGYMDLVECYRLRLELALLGQFGFGQVVDWTEVSKNFSEVKIRSQLISVL